MSLDATLSSPRKSRSQRLRRWGCIVLLVPLSALLLCAAFLLYCRWDISCLDREVRGLTQQRSDIPPVEGYQDLRGAIHVHNELSHDSLATVEQIVEGAKICGVRFVILSNHVKDSPLATRQGVSEGIQDGVLLIPGVEMVTPSGSVLAFGWDGVELSREDPIETTAAKVLESGGLLFCHDEWKDWDAPVVGAELFTLPEGFIHQDYLKLVGLLLTSFGRYPVLCFQEVADYPGERLARWDRTLQKKRFTGIASNDAHRNIGLQWVQTQDGQEILRLADGTLIDETPTRWEHALLRHFGNKGRGEVETELMLDEYANSFSYVGTHVLAPELSKEAVLDALRQGRCYLGYEGLCDASGFQFIARAGERRFLMGEETSFADGLELEVASPVPCEIRLIKDGKLLTTANSRDLRAPVTSPGVYRVECWVKLRGRDRLWILSNPITFRAP